MATHDPALAALATIPAGGAGDPFVRAFTLLSALRRRWRLWVVTALGGLLLAGVFFAAKPPQWSATTTILLRRPTISAADPSRQMETDVQLAQSSGILHTALAHLPRGTLMSYTVSSLTNDVLQITAQSPTAAGAMQSADTVANTFLASRGRQLMQEAQVLVTALKNQTDPLAAKVASVNDQINTAGQSPARAQNGLGELLTMRAQLDGQLASIQQRSDDADISATVAAQSSRVLDPAYPSRPSTLSSLGVDLAAGLIGGAAMGAGWVVFAAATTERLRRREDVMVAIDAPVAVSVVSMADRHRVRGRQLRLHRDHLPRRHRKPGRDLNVMVRHLRRALAASHTVKPALLVVSVDSDWSAAPVVAAAAAELRGEGNEVLMADFSKEKSLARLLRATGPLATVEAGPPASKLWLGSTPPDFNPTLDEWLPLSNPDGKADIILVLATLDPAVGAEHFVLADTAVVVVTAGRSTATALRSTAQMIRAAAVHLHSAILVGADPTDESCGMPQRQNPGSSGTLTGPRNR